MTWVGPDLYASVNPDGIVKVDLDNMTYQLTGLSYYTALAYDGSALFASNYGGFYKIDLNTVTATYISNTIADAMVYFNGVLYGAAGTDLFTIDPISGEKTLIGSGSYDIDALAVSNGVMYGANQSRRYNGGTGDFFTVDMSSGAQTLISNSIPHTDALVTLNPPVAINYYCNNDNDGYADSSSDGTCTGYGCQPAGCQTAPGGDCDDHNAAIHPGAAELCDGLDNNCNGDIDEGIGAYNVETIYLNPGKRFGVAPHMMAFNKVTKRLYVINENGVLSVIDGSTDTLIKNIILGNGNYSSIDVNTALNNVYITDKANNKLIVVDGYSNTVRARIGVGSSPQKVAVNENTQRVYVSNFGFLQNPGNNTVTVIKALTNTVEATITVGKNPIGIGIYKKMNKVFIANEGSGTASVIEGNPSAPQFNQVIATIQISGPNSDWGPARVGINETTNKVYVLNRGNVSNGVQASVAVIDGIYNTLTAKVPIPGVYWSNRLKVKEDDNLIVVSDNEDINGNGLDKYIIINGSSNLVIGPGPVEDVGEMVDRVSINETTDLAYLYLGEGDSIFVVDMNRYSPTFNHVVSTVLLQTYYGESGDMAMDVAANLVYAAGGEASNRVVTIDGSTNTVRNLIDVGGGPAHLAIDSIRNIVWTAHDGSASGVRKIDGVTHSITNIDVEAAMRVVVLDEIGNWLYAYNDMKGDFLVPVKGSDNSVKAAIPVGRVQDHAAVNKLTGRMYLGNPAVHSLIVVDVNPASPAFRTVIASIPVGPEPEGVAVNEVDNWIYSANNDGTVSAVNGADYSQVTTISVAGNDVDNIVINGKTKKAYVSYDYYPHGVKVIDVDPASPGFNTVINTIDLTSQPEDLAVNETTNRIYVNIDGNSTIGIINGSSDTLEAVIPLTDSDNLQFAVDEGLGRIYAADAYNNAVHVIDGDPSSPEFNTILRTFSVGKYPWGIGVNKNTHKVYVANYGSNTINVLTPFIIDIKANGSDGPVTIKTSNTLAVTVSLNTGCLTGDNADWWVVTDTPFPAPNDWYHYNLSSWLPGLSVTYQGPLFDLAPYQVLNKKLPVGAYTFYFGVDMLMNGVLNMGPGEIYYDSVGVNVTP